MLKSKLLISLVATALLTACGPEKVSFDTLEAARLKAKENAEFNAKQYRSKSIYLSHAIESSTDSTMTATCPQGDGWVSVKLVNPEDAKQTVRLKCSTVSTAVGCLLEDDFKQKDYGNDDGFCQSVNKVPFPIPTLNK